MAIGIQVGKMGDVVIKKTKRSPDRHGLDGPFIDDSINNPDLPTYIKNWVDVVHGM